MSSSQPIVRVASWLVPVLFATGACAQAPAPSPASSPSPTATASPDADAPRVITYQFGLLRKGPKWAPAKGDELRPLQEAHLANIQRLADTGAIVAAGPINATGTSDLRGIFLFKSASLEEAQALADSDPMIKNGRLKIELMPLLGTSGIGAHYAEAKTKNGGKDEMLSYQFVLMKDGPRFNPAGTTENEQLGLARRAWLQQVSNQKTLVLAGPFTGGAYRGLMVFRLDSPEAAATVMQGDPTVKTERMAFEVHTWLCAKGVLEAP